ncbi:hypothetical protein [Rhodoplanes sp. Z2-YC6860]|uniref:hypothetical protein n=1 Tax=Rhodoplanes sp. Z2-YC6860 TaxID=674703 RepID=UPI00078C4814|nr:hypothetical protein [Rhodoplanes sp. Z2-YC6860]AMN43719.1 hypothetical protein RHPLAN_53020 [Rhodoplanes sp. Z2-YC6860]
MAFGVRRNTVASTALLFVAVIAGASLAWGQHTHHGGGEHEASGHVNDDREFVRLPDALREHTLTNMRDHLLALQEVQEAIGRGQEEAASRLAEQRLGMSSLSLHGAQEIAKYMPQGMQDIGTQMHREASRFAIEVQNSGVTGDLKPALAALSKVTGACVACHSAYRLQ